jgi:hypothetical protein
MTDYTAEELEIIALIERMRDSRLTASEAAIVLVQAYAIGEPSEPPAFFPGGELDRTEEAVAAEPAHKASGLARSPISRSGAFRACGRHSPIARRSSPYRSASHRRR